MRHQDALEAAGGTRFSPSASQSSQKMAGPAITDEGSAQHFKVSLTFKAPAVEGEYLMEVAKSRWPVLAFIFSFDIACYFFRFLVKLFTLSTNSERPMDLFAATVAVISDIGPQLANMALLYVTISLLNRRSRKHGDTAARQEELLLSVLMAMAICNLLASLGAGAPQDYVYAAFFLICTSTFLKIRWWVGTLVLATPVALLHMWQRGKHQHVALPPDAMVHILVAWAVGGLMAYLAEWYRRQMFSSQRAAAVAHQKELLEAQARMRAQRQLAAAQAQAAQRALVVARDKAAHEAQIEFMSLMCHEVRTPLNGCLASAEMLLETALCSEQRELANTIKVSGSILLSTVSNFLDFFKMEAGKTLDIVRTEVDLLQLVHDVHCIIEAMVGRSGEVRLLHPELTMSAESIGLDGLHRIVCDPDRVRGILLNLYTNAAKFTKQGHIGLRVQEVSGQHEPSPGEGYGSVTVTPAYQPFTRPTLGSAFTAHPSKVDGSVAGLTGGRLSLAVEDIQTEDEADIVMVDASGLPGPVPGGETSAAGASTNGAETGEAVAEVGTSSDGVAAERDAGEPSTSSAGEQSKWLLFEVMDTGVGITQDGLHALFKEYCQGTEDDMRKPRSKGGTGLGLSICSKQVAVLGGRIGAYSSPDKGSVFWFTIPLILPERLNAVSVPSAPVSGAFAQSGSALAGSAAPGVEIPHITGWPAQVVTQGVGSVDGAVGTPPAAAAPTGAVSMILQSNPAATHQYAVSHADRGSLAQGSGGTAGLPVGSTGLEATGRSIGRSAGRGHKSLDMPPHFTMDPDQPSIAHVMQRRMANVPGGAGQIAYPHHALSQQLNQHNMFSVDDVACGPVSAGTAYHISRVKSSGALLACHNLGHQSQGINTTLDSPSYPLDEHLIRVAAATTAAVAGVQVPGSPAMVASMEANSHSMVNGMEHWPAVRTQGMTGPGYISGSHALVSAAMQRNSLSGSPVPHSSGPTVGFTGSTLDAPSCLGQPPVGPSRNSFAIPSGISTNEPLLPPGALSMSLTAAAPSGIIQQAPAAPPVTVPSPLTSALHGRRVLLVEDNLINQTVARKMLAGLGMQCQVASNGLEAVNAVEAVLGWSTGGFDVVLMDMMMPVMGGVEATKRIRELEAQHVAAALQHGEDTASASATEGEGASSGDIPQESEVSTTSMERGNGTNTAGAAPTALAPAVESRKGGMGLVSSSLSSITGLSGSTAMVAGTQGLRVPILAMTANASDRDREECRAAGMDGFLSKPVLKDRLADAILQVLAGGAWSATSGAQR